VIHACMCIECSLYVYRRALKVLCKLRCVGNHTESTAVCAVLYSVCVLAMGGGGCWDCAVCVLYACICIFRCALQSVWMQHGRARATTAGCGA
jgi:hypothetical protein